MVMALFSPVPPRLLVVANIVNVVLDNRILSTGFINVVLKLGNVTEVDPVYDVVPTGTSLGTDGKDVPSSILTTVAAGLVMEAGVNPLRALLTELMSIVVPMLNV